MVLGNTRMSLMIEDNCLFCMIVKEQLPSYKIWEDENYLAILDIFPNIKGQTVVMPKKHLDSDAFALSDKELTDFMIATKRVANLLVTRLDVARVHVVFEGMHVDHLHSKLYPAIGLSRETKQAIAPEKIYFEEYPSYVTTLEGPMAKDEDLKRLQETIVEFRERNKNKENSD